MEGSKTHFRIGSRKSELAMIQSKWVVERLKELHPGTTYDIVGINTIGDKILDVALSKIGEKSLFTKELEVALLDGEIDFVVHSLKDLPTQLPEQLCIAAIAKREDPRDAVLFKSSISSSTSAVAKLHDLPSGSNVGTSSLRRIAQLKRNYPHLSFIDVRGNLNTRLKKLDDPHGPYSALILAAAGVNRMGWQQRIGQYLECDDCMHAVGQGALGIECAEDNPTVLELLENLNDPETYFRCLAERAFLRTLEGGCSVPVAVNTVILKNDRGTTLTLRGSVWSLDGSQSLCKELSRNLASLYSTVCQPYDEQHDVNLTSVHQRVFAGYTGHCPIMACRLGIDLARSLLDEGAKEILDEVKAQSSKPSAT